MVVNCITYVDLHRSVAPDIQAELEAAVSSLTPARAAAPPGTPWANSSGIKKCGIPSRCSR